MSISSYIIDFDKDEHEIIKELRELCCDEYYEYMELIDTEIIKKISTKLSGGKIISELISSCGNSGSIKAFEYLVKRFGIVIQPNLSYKTELIYEKRGPVDLTQQHSIKFSYWKSNFKKYLIDKYNLDVNVILQIISTVYFNKDLDFVKDIYENKLDFINDSKNICNKLLSQFKLACTQNQINIVKFLIPYHKKYITEFTLKDIFLTITMFRTESRFAKIYNRNDKINVLELLYNNFTNIINNEFINNILMATASNNFELLNWIEDKKFIINEKTWLTLLNKVCSQVINKNEIIDEKQIFKLFYYLVGKVQMTKELNNKDWEEIYQAIKYSPNNIIIKYLIDIGIVKVDSYGELYWDYYQNKITFDQRKKYIEYYHLKYEKKSLPKDKSIIL